MLHRPDTWTDALFIYPLYHVNFLTSFMEWFRFVFFNGVTVKTENTKYFCVVYDYVEKADLSKGCYAAKCNNNRRKM